MATAQPDRMKGPSVSRERSYETGDKARVTGIAPDSDTDRPVPLCTNCYRDLHLVGLLTGSAGESAEYESNTRSTTLLKLQFKCADNINMLLNIYDLQKHHF